MRFEMIITVLAQIIKPKVTFRNSDARKSRELLIVLTKEGLCFFPLCCR